MLRQLEFIGQCLLLLTSVLLPGLPIDSAEGYTWTNDLPYGNSSIEYQLKQMLLRGYDVTSRPVRDDKTVITCNLGVSLFHILDTSERHQTVSALLSFRLHWVDEYLRWNRSTYPIEKIWIPSRSIWRPDLIIANYANDEYSDYINTNAIVMPGGKVMWTFPIVVKMYCTLDVRYFPFDTQDCNITLMSWTYDGFRLRLNHTGPDDQKVYYIERNQEWMVTSIVPYLEERIYPCCVEPFPLVHFTIHMYRRCLFYVINLICPCLLIYCVSILGFFLPIESGEKVNLEITVLLALVVFLLMVSEAMPPTPDAVPVVGLLFSVTMLMVALAVVMAVTVTNFYFSEAQARPSAFVLRLARLHRKWRRRHVTASKLEASLRLQRGIARMRRVELHRPHQHHHSQHRQDKQLDSDSLHSADCDCCQRGGDVEADEQFSSGNPGGTPRHIPLQRQFFTPTQCQVPPSASYFKCALNAANGNQASGSLRHQDSFYSKQQPKSPQQQQLPPPQSSLEATVEDFTEDWRAAAFALDKIFFWIFVSLTIMMFLTVSIVAMPAFQVEHPTSKA